MGASPTFGVFRFDLSWSGPFPGIGWLLEASWSRVLAPSNGYHCK
jgi:hypothetical protein